MGKFLNWLGSYGTPANEVPREEKVKPAPDHELYNTFISVPPDMDMSELVAIQWWLKEQGLFSSGRMPVGDILGVAKDVGNALILIKPFGEIDYCGGYRYDGYRKVEFLTSLTVVRYEVEPKTIKVLGENYDAVELREALAKLEKK